MTHTSLPRHILPISDCLVLCVSRTHYYRPRKPQGASGSRSSSFSVNSMGSGLPLHSLLPCFLTLHTIYLEGSRFLQKLTASLVSGVQIRLCLCCRDRCKWHLCLISFHPHSLLRTILMLSAASCLVLILYAVVYLFSHFPFKVCRMDVLCIWHHFPCLFLEMALCVFWFSFPLTARFPMICLMLHAACLSFISF